MTCWRKDILKETDSKRILLHCSHLKDTRENFAKQVVENENETVPSVSSKMEEKSKKGE